MLHGLMAHSGFFERQRDLSQSFRTISIDLRGHGRSQVDGRAPCIEDLAADVTAIVDQLELESAVGIGWSLGAAVLWEVLRGSAAGRFAGAVIVDMSPRVRNEGDWELGLSGDACQARSTAIAEDFRSFATSAGHAIFAQPVAEELQAYADWAGREFAANDPKVIGALWESLVEQDYRRALGQIAQPTLVIHGAHSQLYGLETAEHLAAALPNARAIRFDHSGHAPHIEQAQDFNRIVGDFAASLRVPSAQATAS